MEKLQKIAEEEKKSIEDVKLLFDAYREELKNESPYLSDKRLDIRAVNFVDSHYANDDQFDSGEPFVFVCMGVASNARDVNKYLRDQILEDWSEPDNRERLIKDGKVMVMKVSDKEIDGEDTTFDDVFKPVKKIKDTAELDSGEVIVTEGELWEPGSKPIPRDFRRYMEYGEEEYENSQWSHPLNPKWKMKLFGIGYFTGSNEKGNKKSPINAGKITIVSISGERANPSDPNFILNKPIMFTPCKVKANKTENCNNLFLNVWIRQDNEFEFSDKDIKIEKIVSLINKRVHTEAKTIKQKTEESIKNKDKTLFEKFKSLYTLYKDYIDEDYKYIPFIDLANIHDYHMKYRAIWDEDEDTGEQYVRKNDDGWDYTKFTSFALCQCTFRGVYENKKGGNKYVLRDWSLDKDETQFMKYATGLPKEIPSPSSVMISIQTSRGNMVYDSDIEEWIEDAEHSKAFGRVKGIKLLRDFNKHSLKNLKGDM